jgi:hypothetical protein
MANKARISFYNRGSGLDPKDISQQLKDAKKDGDFVPLADVPDIIWKNNPRDVKGGRDTEHGVGQSCLSHITLTPTEPDIRASGSKVRVQSARRGSGLGAGKKPLDTPPIVPGEAQQYQSADLSLSMFDGGDVALRNTDRLCDIRLLGIEASELAYPASDSLPVDDSLFLRFTR